MQHIPLGIMIANALQATQPRFITYAHQMVDVLQQAGICHRQLEPADMQNMQDAGIEILITAGDLEFNSKQRELLKYFIENGGTWISIAGVCGAQSLLGVEPVAPSFHGGWGSPVMTSLGEHYLTAHDTQSTVLEHLNQPLHGFGGLAARATTAKVLATAADAHGRPTDRVAISSQQIGKGQAIFFATDLTGSLVHIQQGLAVTRDGISDPLGNATVADGVLKTDDGMTLDWDLDRQPVPGCDGLYGFLEPAADLLRVTLIRLILDAAHTAKIPLSVLWYWPDKLPGVGHLSFDSDGNDPALAKRLLELCTQAKMVATWCVICPGYEKPLIKEIHDQGHELAMHYDAMTQGKPWSRQQFDSQHAELVDLFEGQRPTSNKNHYFRWEGDCDYFRWLQSVGIDLDQSKGSSKSGEFGFVFGTCHPYHPTDESGQRMHVLELPTPTGDIPKFAPLIATKTLLEKVLSVHGVYHLLFHPAHMGNEQVCQAVLAVVAQGKAAGLAWWTARQISQWLHARETASWQQSTDGLSISTTQPLPNATLLTLLTDETAAKTTTSAQDTMTCWGYRFSAKVISPNVVL